MLSFWNDGDRVDWARDDRNEGMHFFSLVHLGGVTMITMIGQPHIKSICFSFAKFLNLLIFLEIVPLLYAKMQLVR